MKNTILCIAFIVCALSATTQNTWTQMASLTALNGRVNATGFSIGHYGFIGLGNTPSGFANDFWQWDQNTNTWSPITNYPGAGRWGVTSFTIAGKGYSCFGWSGSANENDLWEYDTATKNWTQKATFPGAPRYGSFVFVLGAKAYIGCGEPNGPSYYQDVWVYNSMTDTWKQLANFPGGIRTSLCAFALNGHGYAGCGWDYSTTYSDMWKYDTATDTWTSVASFPISVTAPVSFVLDTLAYAGTGYYVSGGTYYRDFWNYSSTTNKWTSISTLPGAGRWLGVGFSIGSCGYVGTGEDSAGDMLQDYWGYCSGSQSNEAIAAISQKFANMNIYPNPSSGVIHITYELGGKDAELVIMDMYGRHLNSYILNGRENEITLDETFLNDGMYFYQLTLAGKLISSGKFIISR
ncbi:MAG TPA: kelch repeat-containing protein [Bacteroidia bacterium]|jgi:N-acetylneuraminic acid mutarotase|nr:kelch repeat-containing protein [Bacteroidia bacterium]